MTLTRLPSISGCFSAACTERNLFTKASYLNKQRSSLLLVPFYSPNRSYYHKPHAAASWQGLPRTDTYEVDLNHIESGRESVTAKILIHAPVKIVWEVLTNFAKLVDIVPNLIACEELPSPNPQTKRIKQSAGLKCDWWRLQAEAILDVQSYTRPNGDKELHFQMIDGDFKEYHGRFLIEGRSNDLSCALIFDAVIEPLECIPEMLFVHAIQIWLPFNLNGIVQKAEEIALERARVSPFTAASIEAEVLIKTGLSTRTSTQDAWYARALRNAKAKRVRRQNWKATPADYLGTAFVPLPTKAPEFQDTYSIKEKTVPKFEIDETQIEGIEVHLRKLDTAEYLHRRVVCSQHIMAPISFVWKTLTDYERLVDFIPNLSISEFLSCPEGAPENYKRLRQVVRKKQSYIQLQAESILDVVEIPYKEIQFRQVSGFLRTLQGKWVLKELTNEFGEKDTFLTYALEMKTKHSEIPLELIEPVFEQAAIEGLPLNLTAVKQEVLRIQGKPSLGRLCRDFDALKNELFLTYGNQGNYLPTREELRKDHNSYLEKAISSHGGTAMVAERMGWKLKNKARKRRGYWDDFRNVEQEIMDFKLEYGLSDDHIPSKKDFNEAGRVDLRRAIEKWGGISAVMELMEYKEPDKQDLRLVLNNDITRSIQSRKMELDVRDLDNLS